MFVKNGVQKVIYIAVGLIRSRHGRSSDHEVWAWAGAAEQTFPVCTQK